MRLSSHATIREVLTSGFMSGVIDGVLVTLIYLTLLLPRADARAWVLIVPTSSALSRSRRSSLAGEAFPASATREHGRSWRSAEFWRAYQVEMLAGIETLKASGSEARAVESWTDLFVDTLNVEP